MEAIQEQKPFQVSLIMPEHLSQVWGDCEKLLYKSCHRSGGRIKPINILYRLNNNECSLWIIFEEKNLEIVGCVITRIHTYPADLKMLHIEHLAGKKMHDWIDDGLEVMYDWAKVNNCKGVEGVGRGGFWNWIKNKDWEETARFYEIKFDEVKDEIS